jgi:hypothetical protein
VNLGTDELVVEEGIRDGVGRRWRGRALGRPMMRARRRQQGDRTRNRGQPAR